MDEVTFIHKRHAERLIELHEGPSYPVTDPGYAFRRRAEGVAHACWRRCVTSIERSSWVWPRG